VIGQTGKAEGKRERGRGRERERKRKGKKCFFFERVTKFWVFFCC
jgi:hypothetical protein